MIRSTISRSTVLAVAFSCVATIALADAGNNDTTSKFTDTAKQKAKQSLEWTEQKCAEMKKEWQETIARGKAKGQAFVDEARARIDARFSKERAENNPTPERVVINEPKPSDLIDIKVPFEVPADAKPTGAEPIKRGGAVVTEEEIGGQAVQVSSIELGQDASWLEFLDTPEGRTITAGVIAVVTIAGVTYVLYKNRVPQRIYGYVAQNPLKSCVITAGVIAVAAYIAQANGVTFESIKEKVCVSTTA